MYINVFGGSALLHLLLGYPRLILVLGIAGTVAATNTPHGPGRVAGTGQYLAALDAEIGQRATNSDTAERTARQSVTNMLESYDPVAIEKTVAETLDACGDRCTDLSTPIVIGDTELLRRVLTLHELDRLWAASQRRAATPPVAGGRSVGK